MRRIIKLSLFISAAILLAGCAPSTTNNYTQTTQSWRGGNVKSLIARWGTPDMKTPAPNGNTYYAYKTVSYRANHNEPRSPVGINVSRTGRAVITTQNGVSNNLSQEPMPLTCVVIYEVNKQGQVVGNKVEGKGCYASDVFTSAHSNPGR